MRVTCADFITSATEPKGYPPPGPAEIAFAGRSNVGKSSLINSLIARKGLVKVSKTPGKTQLLNFFDLNKGAMTFVDMPGYGFARAPLSVKRSWGKMVDTYLKKRETLKGVICLLDCRRTPNEDDRALMEWLVHGKTPFIIVITKIDKVAKTHRPREIKKVMASISDLVGEVTPLLFSSHTGEGKRELWQVIEELATP
jgi:GTP-binding protein